MCKSKRKKKTLFSSPSGAAFSLSPTSSFSVSQPSAVVNQVAIGGVPSSLRVTTGVPSSPRVTTGVLSFRFRHASVVDATRIVIAFVCRGCSLLQFCRRVASDRRAVGFCEQSAPLLPSTVSRRFYGGVSLLRSEFGL